MGIDEIEVIPQIEIGSSNGFLRYLNNTNLFAMRILACLFSLLMTSMLMIGCKDKDVEGCTDPNSTNYNPDATINDGSCTYAVDRFCGNWNYTDTIHNQTTATDTIVSRFIVITRTGWNTVKIAVLGGVDCLVEVNATGSGDVLTIAAQDNNAFYCSNSASISGSGQLSGNQLRLSYFFDWFMPNLHDKSCHGTAVR